ncbi:MAG: alpha/beta hydrolase [Bdellovibrionaceae bacterium]|nr:alpha/beta hydrolase [Pseudobdellovibrionaceae bacterium]
MKFVLSLILMMGMGLSQAWALNVDEEGILELAKDHTVYYRYTKPVADKPTVVLLNGLIYSISHWDQYYQEMTQKGYGVLQVAYSTQPESLRGLEGEAPYFSRFIMTLQGPSMQGLETKDLASDILKTADFLGIKKFHLLTLSYGSIVGSHIANHHADRVLSVILVAPAVISSNRYIPYGASRHAHYLLQHKVNVNPFYDPDYFYDAEIYQSMRLIMQPQIATLDLEGVGFENFFNGVYQMARSAKYFDLKDQADKAWPKTTLVMASIEDAPLQKDQLQFWKLKQQAAKNSQLIFVDGAPHAIPGAYPKVMSMITDAILESQVTKPESTFSIDSAQWWEGCVNSKGQACEQFVGSSSGSSSASSSK